jgi:ectoine hydroxylase-related dioxygenase (phytanoyl-CoA dioxygenase family)
MQSLSNATRVSEGDCELADLAELISADLAKRDASGADRVERNIPIYNGQRIRELSERDDQREALLAEWNRVFEYGSGVVVIEGAFAQLDELDQVTELLSSIIQAEAAGAVTAGDHFAAPGANSRLWNAHEKLAIANPSLFVSYYANPVVHLASLAWLGPNYQITAQVNVVHPGGNSQVCHRDYHLGFQSIEQLMRYPRNVHLLSPHLTLQGAIAHVDMPIASGPTKVLPFSQQLQAGYLATQQDQFRDYFEQHHVQLPLKKGDMMFFNPAVFHAAGENRTERDRFANLWQIGSAFGRTTELVNRTKLCHAIYPTLLEASQNGSLTARQVEDVIAATAEGYAFPCNLDLTPPVGGLAPRSQQDIMRQLLASHTPADEFSRALDEWQAKYRT